MNILKIISLCILAALSGCSIVNTIDDSNANNENLTQQWEQIGSGEAQISLMNEEQKVAYRRSLSFEGNSTYLESLALDKGSITYGRYKNFIPTHKSLTEFLKHKASNTKEFLENGYFLIDKTIQTKVINKNNIAYGLLKSENKSEICLFFASEYKKNKDYEIAIGTYCDSNNLNNLSLLQENLLNKIVKKITFDRGNHARNQLFEKANKRLAKLRKKDLQVEKNKPIIKLKNVFKDGNDLIIDGVIVDDSDINSVWIANVMIDVKSKQDFFVRIKNADFTDLKLTAIDSYGNTSVKRLDYKSLNNTLTKTPVVYDNVKTNGINYALIIAIEDYKNNEADFDLDTPINDAVIVKNTLEKDYGFKVETLINPTEKSFRDHFSKLNTKLNANDKVLIYYAGHGYLYPENSPKSQQSSYWLMSDFDFEHPERWISDVELRQIVSKIPSKQLMLVSDSCYSGRLTSDSHSIFNTSNNGIIRTVFTSGSDQPVPDSFDKTNSPFAIEFVNSLKNETSNNLFGNRLYKKVVKNMLDSGNFYQEPQYGELVNALHQKGSDFKIK